MLSLGTYPFWPGNTLGSPQEELGRGQQVFIPKPVTLDKWRTMDKWMFKYSCNFITKSNFPVFYNNSKLTTVCNFNIDISV